MTGQQIGLIGLCASIFLVFGGLAFGRVLETECVSGRAYFPRDKDQFVDTAHLCNVRSSAPGRTPSDPKMDKDREYVECTCR